jgi:hypothetical protein
LIAPNPYLFHYFWGIPFVIYAHISETQLGSAIQATCIVAACHCKGHCLDQHEILKWNFVRNKQTTDICTSLGDQHALIGQTIIQNVS